jgi:cytidyltransferase-like protein
MNEYIKKVVLVTGGFDPVHSGHISYLNHADHLGDHLVVGLNSDDWLTRKKGRAFMPWQERMVVLDNLHMVDEVIDFNDDDGSSIDAILKVKSKYPNSQIIFANGGDRTATNIPEMSVPDITFEFGVGGEDKKNSSSWILQEWKAPKTERQWGYYRVLHQVPGMKVKELTVNPGQKLSMQRHQHRAEYWIVSEGRANVNSMMAGGYALPTSEIALHEEYKVPVGEWHQLTNPFDVPLKIVEIQYGSQCDEDDIERKLL